MGTNEERPAKAYFKKMYENEIYEVHFKELKGTLIASSSDLWDLMEGFSKEKTQHQAELIEKQKELIDQLFHLIKSKIEETNK
tara:strand:- start:327 stop:575 length:249 start_codon:yes stop_codon:yes gene_type:complete